jgi:hypothetical protein
MKAVLYVSREKSTHGGEEAESVIKQLFREYGPPKFTLETVNVDELNLDIMSVPCLVVVDDCGCASLPIVGYFGPQRREIAELLQLTS